MGISSLFHTQLNLNHRTIWKVPCFLQEEELLGISPQYGINFKCWSLAPPEAYLNKCIVERCWKHRNYWINVKTENIQHLEMWSEFGKTIYSSSLCQVAADWTWNQASTSHLTLQNLVKKTTCQTKKIFIWNDDFQIRLSFKLTPYPWDHWSQNIRRGA